jgi:hypothetical protein
VVLKENALCFYSLHNEFEVKRIFAYMAIFKTLESTEQKLCAMLFSVYSKISSKIWTYLSDIWDFEYICLASFSAQSGKRVVKWAFERKKSSGKYEQTLVNFTKCSSSRTCETKALQTLEVPSVRSETCKYIRII